MVQKISGHYTPMWDEIVGVAKVFFLVWIVSTIILFIILGVNKWAFWGAVALGLIVAFIGTLILALLTGASITLPFQNKEDKQ